MCQVQFLLLRSALGGDGGFVGGEKYILVFMTSCSLSSGITLICPGSRTKKGRGLWMDFGAVHHSVLVD